MCISTQLKRHRPAAFSFDSGSLLVNTCSPPVEQPTINVINLKKVNVPASSHLVVHHNYHDHANDVYDESSHTRPCRGGVKPSFPFKLHEMLERVEEDGRANIVSWQPHGRSFVVHKPEAFKEILSEFFKQSKMSSFNRQLSLYGFKRFYHGRDKGGYYHELFLRGKKFLVTKINRTGVKGTKVRARSNPSEEPNFWEMSWVGCEANSHPEDTKTECGEGSDHTPLEMKLTSPIMDDLVVSSMTSLPTEEVRHDRAAASSPLNKFQDMEPLPIFEDPQQAQRRSGHISNDEMNDLISELNFDIFDEINEVEDDCDDYTLGDLLLKTIMD